MNERAAGLLAKGEEELKEAELLLREDLVSGAASRVYYAMFHAAEALLEGEGLRFKTHRGVHGGFAQRFVVTGAFDHRYHEWLIESFDRRSIADYELGARPGSPAVEASLGWARDFLDAARSYLERDGQDR